VSNTLGTALATSRGQPRAWATQEQLLISSLLAIIALLYFFTKRSRTILFLAAFVLTRRSARPWATC
jgi:uncharacterized membrane-anchored protein